MADKGLFVKIARLLNFGCAGLMVLDAIFRFIDFGDITDLFFMILAIYLLLFAALLVVAELRIKRVLIYLEFLRSRIGLGLYIILIGLLVFDESRNYDIGISVVMVIIGIFNVIVGLTRKDDGNQNEGDFEREGTTVYKKQFFSSSRREDA
jgi:hypothetical protein